MSSYEQVCSSSSEDLFMKYQNVFEGIRTLSEEMHLKIEGKVTASPGSRRHKTAIRDRVGASSTLSYCLGIPNHWMNCWRVLNIHSQIEDVLSKLSKAKITLCDIKDGSWNKVGVSTAPHYSNTMLTKLWIIWVALSRSLMTFLVMVMETQMSGRYKTVNVN